MVVMWWSRGSHVVVMIEVVGVEWGDGEVVGEA